MSVAFRRESDDEHLEPKFAIPLPPGANIVTPHGLELIHAKVADWAAAVAAAQDEDARKKAARDLAYWNTRLSTARVADPPAANVVGIGSTVTFRLRDVTRTLAIVGHDEADPTAGSIAFSAPLAKAMVGSGAGDVVEFGAETIEIIETR